MFFTKAYEEIKIPSSPRDFTAKAFVQSPLHRFHFCSEHLPMLKTKVTPTNTLNFRSIIFPPFFRTRIRDLHKMNNYRMYEHPLNRF